MGDEDNTDFKTFLVSLLLQNESLHVDPRQLSVRQVRFITNPFTRNWTVTVSAFVLCGTNRCGLTKPLGSHCFFHVTFIVTEKGRKVQIMLSFAKDDLG